MSFASITGDMTNWIENGGKEGPVEGEHSQLNKKHPEFNFIGVFFAFRNPGVDFGLFFLVIFRARRL